MICGEVARRNTTADTVTQSVYKVSADQKRALLKHIVTSRNLWQFYRDRRPETYANLAQI